MVDYDDLVKKMIEDFKSGQIDDLVKKTIEGFKSGQIAGDGDDGVPHFCGLGVYLLFVFGLVMAERLARTMEENNTETGSPTAKQ